MISHYKTNDHGRVKFGLSRASGRLGNTKHPRVHNFPFFGLCPQALRVTRIVACRTTSQPDFQRQSAMDMSNSNARYYKKTTPLNTQAKASRMRTYFTTGHTPENTHYNLVTTGDELWKEHPATDTTNIKSPHKNLWMVPLMFYRKLAHGVMRCSGLSAPGYLEIPGNMTHLCPCLQAYA